MLRYSIILKAKDGAESGATTTELGNNETRVALDDGSRIDMPTVGEIHDGSGTVTEIDVNVTTRTQGSQYIIDFEFPSFSSGMLYYDPTISSSSSSATSATVSASLIVALTVMCTALLAA